MVDNHGITRVIMDLKWDIFSSKEDSPTCFIPWAVLWFLTQYSCCFYPNIVIPKSLESNDIFFPVFFPCLSQFLLLSTLLQTQVPLFLQGRKFLLKLHIVWMYEASSGQRLMAVSMRLLSFSDICNVMPTTFQMQIICHYNTQTLA